jgi:PAS domain S-box-containing protein
MDTSAAYARSVSSVGWEVLFWTLFDGTTNPIVVLDDELRFIAVNEPAQRTLGHTRGFLMGRRSLDVTAPDAAKGHIQLGCWRRGDRGVDGHVQSVQLCAHRSSP